MERRRSGESHTLFRSGWGADNLQCLSVRTDNHRPVPVRPQYGCPDPSVSLEDIRVRKPEGVIQSAANDGDFRTDRPEKGGGAGSSPSVVRCHQDIGPQALAGSDEAGLGGFRDIGREEDAYLAEGDLYDDAVVVIIETGKIDISSNENHFYKTFTNPLYATDKGFTNG